MGAIETPFLTFLIFIQFEANLAQSNFEYNFYNAYKQKILKNVDPSLISSFLPGSLNSWQQFTQPKISDNNKVVKVMSATNGVKHKTMKKHILKK